MMLNVVGYSPRSTGSNSSAGSGSGGGDVEDILRRWGNVETAVSEMRTQVGAIAATVPHLATAASISEVKSQVSDISAIIPHMATKADLASMESAIIKWIIATTLTSAALAFTIAKFVH